MNRIKSVIEYAMRMENDAMEFYSFNLERVEAPELKKSWSDITSIIFK